MSEVFDLGPTRLRVVAATDEATVIEGELQPGGGSAWHTHTLEDETILVVEGTLVVDDGEPREVGAGEAHGVLRPACVTRSRTRRRRRRGCTSSAPREVWSGSSATS